MPTKHPAPLVVLPNPIRSFHVNVYDQKKGGCWIVLSSVTDKLPDPVFKQLSRDKRRRIAIGQRDKYEILIFLNPPKGTLIALAQNPAHQFATWHAYATMSEMFPRTTARIYIPKAQSTFFDQLPARKVGTLYHGSGRHYFLGISE